MFHLPQKSRKRESQHPGLNSSGERLDSCHIEHLPIHEAQELLDWLEGNGVESREVSVISDGYVSVCWQS
jgi:hypothetical protein